MIQTIQIIHNPTAGEANHSKEWLTEMIAKFAAEVRYVSTKDKAWNTFKFNPKHPIFLAGGDGTTRKVIKKLLEVNGTSLPSSSPIILCPCGKANNIAKSLNILKTPIGKINFDLNTVEHYCYGRVKNSDTEGFFIESFGFGVFPELLVRKNGLSNNNYSSEVKLQLALRKLIKVVDEIKPEKLKIKMDALTIKGSFILAEVMKIKHMGPNLPLSLSARIGTPFFYLVLIPEDRREDFSNYLQGLLMGVKATPPIDFIISIRTSKLKIKSKRKNYHIDDNLVQNHSEDYLKLRVQNTQIPFVRNVEYL